MKSHLAQIPLGRSMPKAFLFSALPPCSFVANGMAQTAGQKSTTESAAQAAERHVAVEGSIGGIGAKLAKTNGVLTVERVVPSSPTEEASLAAGWQINSINGIPTSSMELNNATKLLRGTIGTEVRLEVTSPSNEHRQVTLVRRKILLAPVQSRLLDGGLLLMRLTSLDNETPGQLRALLAKYSDTKGIVLDLRENVGVSSRAAIQEVLELFLPKGSILWFFRDANGRVSEVKSSASGQATLPLVVLTSHQTSFPEVVASALQQNGRAKVVGQPTPGWMNMNSVENHTQNADGSSRVQMGHLQFSRDGLRTNVIPDKVLAAGATDEEFLQAAREMLAGPVKADLTERLKKLQSLYDQGQISKEEFEKKKQEIMDSL
jgi:C-terminal peptidase prc